MKSVVVLGNWKANKTIEEAKTWLAAFTPYAGNIPSNVRVILCPAFSHIPLFLDTKFPVSLGVQDISPFDSGAYTGSIAASMLKTPVSYALIGHSERRTHFGETDALVVQKVKQSLSHNIVPILCVSEISQAEIVQKEVPDFSSTGMVLYEPLFAVGSGTPDTPPNANAVAAKLVQTFGHISVLYGGSVTSENVASFVAQESISGVGVGKGSLDAETFFQIIHRASSAS